MFFGLGPLRRCKDSVTVLDPWEVPTDIEDLVADEDARVEEEQNGPPTPLPFPKPEPEPLREPDLPVPLPVPPPPARAAEPVRYGPAGHRVASGARQSVWGKWTISEIHKGGAGITGYGANCLDHHDPDGGGHGLRCTKPMTMGRCFSEQEVLAKLKLWLLMGLDIKHAHPRTQHVHAIDARALPVLTDAELDQRLRDRGIAP